MSCGPRVGRIPRVPLCGDTVCVDSSKEQSQWEGKPLNILALRPVPYFGRTLGIHVHLLHKIVSEPLACNILFGFLEDLFFDLFLVQ